LNPGRATMRSRARNAGTATDYLPFEARGTERVPVWRTAVRDGRSVLVRPLVDRDLFVVRHRIVR
jgi:hypothetical protein